MRSRYELHYGNRRSLCAEDRPATILQMFQETVRKRARAIALVDADVRYTYAELDERVAALAAGLSHYGVAKGDRIATMLANGVAAIEVSLACAQLGAIHVSMSVRQRHSETQYMLNDCGAAVLVFDVACTAEVPAFEEVPSLRHCFVVDGGANPDGGMAYAQLFSHGISRETCEVDEEDPACILYTSGTTGRPKGAILTHLGIVHSCIHMREAFELTPDDCAVLAVPVSHVTGLVVVCLPIIMVGGRIAILEAFRAAQFLDLAETERLSVTVMVPAMYNLCLLDPTFLNRDLSSWRIAGFGGAPMPEATVERLAEALPNLRLASIYGATETTGPAVIMPSGFGVDRAGSVGRAVSNCDIRLMDDDGHEVATGEAGEVWIAGPNVIPAYWNDKAGTEAAFVDGYWKSGDIGSIDEEGFLSIFDRKKDMINRGGFKIYSVEVENVLSHIDGVVEAAVIGRPCPVLGERVHAFVVVNRDDVTIDSIKEYCSIRLSDYKVPEFIDISSLPLPRSSNGKLLKVALRDWELGSAT